MPTTTGRADARRPHTHGNGVEVRLGPRPMTTSEADFSWWRGYDGRHLASGRRVVSPPKSRWPNRGRQRHVACEEVRRARGAARMRGATLRRRVLWGSQAKCGPIVWANKKAACAIESFAPWPA